MLPCERHGNYRNCTVTISTSSRPKDGIIIHLSLETFPARLSASVRIKDRGQTLAPRTSEAHSYALFDGDKQIGNSFPTKKEVWKAALIEALVTDVPVADEEGGQVIPKGYRVKRIDYDAQPIGNPDVAAAVAIQC